MKEKVFLEVNGCFKYFLVSIYIVWLECFRHNFNQLALIIPGYNNNSFFSVWDYIFGNKAKQRISKLVTSVLRFVILPYYRQWDLMIRQQEFLNYCPKILRDCEITKKASIRNVTLTHILNFLIQNNVWRNQLKWIVARVVTYIG